MDEIQTMVVHMNQLTQENMHALAENGYTILRDPELLIFAKKITKATPNGNDPTLDGLPNDEVVSLSKERVHRSKPKGN